MMDLLPLFQKVRIELEYAFSAMQIGDRIPTEHEIAQTYDVSRVTARKALEAFRKEGVVKSYQGRGSFLAKKPDRPLAAGVKTRLIGIVVPDAQDQLSQIIGGVEAKASALNYHIILSHDQSDPKLQAEQIRNLAAKVEGLLIYPNREATERPDFLKALKQINEHGMPIVLLDRYIPGINLPCVMTDNIRGMYEATEHMICCGRRRPALIGFWETNTVHKDRRKGFIDAIRAAGIMEPVLEANTGTRESFGEAAYDIAKEWIAGKSAQQLPFDSVACMNDEIAHGAFLALNEAGIKVPEHVSLVGYDNEDSPLFRMHGLQLTSVEQPLAQMGAIAAEMLIERIERKPAAQMGSHRLLPPKLVLRTSCGPQQ